MGRLPVSDLRIGRMGSTDIRAPGEKGEGGKSFQREKELRWRVAPVSKSWKIVMF